MREVALTIGRRHLPSGVFACVDDEDSERVNQHHWRLFMANGRRMYAVTGDATLLHRFLLSADAGQVIEHVNGNGLDCTRSNLRLVTPSQMAATQWTRAVWSRNTTKTSTFKGVSRIEGRSRPWRATVSVNGKQEFLGYYAEEEEAAKAYDDAARRFFGGFARTNFELGDA